MAAVDFTTMNMDHPNVPFQFRKISDYGTSNPIVARLSIQTVDLCRLFFPDEKSLQPVFDVYGFKVQPKLLECFRIREELVDGLIKIDQEMTRQGLQTRPCSSLTEIPSVPRLQTQCESFLYNAKACLRELVVVINVFFGTDFNSPRFDKIVEWAIRTFGKEHELSRMLTVDHDLWIERIVTFRNAIEHPGGKLEELHIYDIDLVPFGTGCKLAEPCWAYGSGPRTSIAADMETTIENILWLAEDLLIVLLKTKFPQAPLEFVEIPLEQRNPKMPVRIRAQLALGPDGPQRETQPGSE